MDGESWLDMRVRTQPQRDIIEITQKSNAAFIARARTMSPMACKMALIGIQSLEDIYNGNGHYLVHAGIDLCAIINAWEGGQL